MNTAKVYPLHKLSCLHCDADLSAQASSKNPQSFCCNGCEVVYGLLKNPKPAVPSVKEFSYLDDSDFIKEYATGESREMHFYLEGVHCTSCVLVIDKLASLIPDVESSNLNLSSSVAWVRIHKTGKFSRVAEGLARLGYPPHPVLKGESERVRLEDERRHLIRLGVSGMASGNIMFLAIALYAGATGVMAEVFRWTSFALYLPVFFYSALPFFQSAWSSLRALRVSIDVPIVLGILIGTAASVANLLHGSDHIYFDSLSAIVFLLLATRYLLKKIHRKSEDMSNTLLFLAPSKARRRIQNSLHYETVRTDSLQNGDCIRVLASECFPADGIISKGLSSVHSSLLTGEFLPQGVAPGTPVYAGTWNLESPLEVIVTASGPSTRLGNIASAMEKNLASKPPIVTLLDRVGQWFVVAVLVLTLIGFLLGFQISWQEGINRALAIALVVCPCTFALGTPLAFSLAISLCAKNGIILKGAEVLERLSHVKSVFFDKTGTLTLGELEVVHWKEELPGVAKILLALEMHASHPIAVAVRKYFLNQFDPETLPNIQGFKVKPGFGVSGYVEERQGYAHYEVHRLYDPSTNPEKKSRNNHGEKISTAVGVFRNRELVGSLELVDKLRHDSKHTLDQLKNMGLSIHLLSGDSESPVRTTASQLEIEPRNTLFGASPEQKCQAVQSSEKSLMVGDGANDALALASAYESIAVHGGMEISMKAAGAYSSKPGISPVHSLITVARQTMRVIHRNLAFAIFYNLIGITIALMGHLSPLVAALLMPASALTVFLSTMVGMHRSIKP